MDRLIDRATWVFEIHRMKRVPQVIGGTLGKLNANTYTGNNQEAMELEGH